MKKVFLLTMSIFVLMSCSTRKEIVYFQDIEQLSNIGPIEQFEPRIEINDVLRITVSSLNDELVEPFRLNTENQGGGGGGMNNPALTGYLVNTKGTIQFPVLGRIEVQDLTRSELEEFLTEELRQYITDAVVQVRIVNFKVTLLGETGSIVIDVPDERISVPQALAMGGDISYDGKRDNVLVVRNHNGELSYGRVDMTSTDVFSNPFFYLKQNDIVYVEPTYRKVKSAGFITSWQGLVSIVTTGFSLFVLFNNI